MADKPVDDLGKMNSDVLSEFDIDVEEPKTFGRKVAAPVKGVANIITGTAKGALSGVTSEVRNKFPNTAGLVGDAMGVVDDLKSLKADITSEVTPAWNTLKGITLKMMPMTKLLMPKSLYTKIEKKLKDSYEPEDERSEQQKLEEARTENINQQLSSIFSAQMEMQQLSEAKATAEKQADRLLERTHFKADQAAFASIDKKLQMANNFLSGAFTAYMKKSLELKYRHLYVANDIFNTVRVLTKITEARLEEIKHNTGLPEYAKVTFKERLVGSMKQKAADSLVGWGSKFKDKLMGNLREKIMGDLKNITRDIIPTLAGYSGMFSDPNMVGGPLTKSGVLGKILGFFTGLSTSEKTGQFLDKHDGYIGDMEKAIEAFRKRLPFMAADKLEALRASDNPVIRYLMDAVPTRDISTKIDTKTLLKDPNAVVPFDVSTRAAITQVIPAHLERIGNIVDGFTRYIAPDFKVSDKTFNYVTQRLSDVKEFQHDLEEEMFSSENRARNMEDSLATTMGLAKDNKRVTNLTKDKEIASVAKEKGVENIERFFDSDEFRELQQKFIANMMANQQMFQFDDILEYVDGGNKTDWFKKAFKGLKEKEIMTVCKYYIALCAPGDANHRKRDQVAIDKITNMSLDVLGDVVIDVEMRQMYQRLGAGRFDRWTNAKTGEAVNTADWYNKRHIDDTAMKEQANYIASDIEDYRARKKKVEQLNLARDDQDTKRYRASARNLGLSDVTDILPPEAIKLFGDGLTKVIQPTIEKIGTAFETVRDKVTGVLSGGIIESTYNKVKKTAKKVLKANAVEIVDAFMINSNTLHIDYVVKDVADAVKSRGNFEIHSSAGDWEAPSWDEVKEAWINHEREELHGKLKSTDYAAAVKKFKSEGSKEDVSPFRRWKRERKAGIRGEAVVASDAIVEQVLADNTKPNVSETPSEKDYIATMRYEMHNALVVDIPSKLQSIITMMHDSDLFVKSEKHGSSDKAENDDIAIRVKEGEMIANKEQQQRMMEAINASLDKDHKLSGQKALFDFLGIPWDDNDTPLFRKGGKARRKGGKKRPKNNVNRSKQINQNAKRNKNKARVKAAVPAVTGVSIGHKVADAVDTSVDFVSEKATTVVDYAKDRLKDLADTSFGKTVTGAATSVWNKIKGWCTTLKDTIVNRDHFLSKFPEKWREKIGSAYDTVVSKSNDIGDYFKKVSKDLKIDKLSNKITDTLSEAANTITDPTARRHFIVSATQQLINIKDTITDPDKRKEALDKAKDSLEQLAGKLKNVKTKEKSKGIKGFFRKKWVQAKMLWRKVKQSKFGKWVGGLIDDETKAKIKEDFKSAKDSIKSGWTDMKEKVSDAFGFKKDEKQEDTPGAKNPTPADVAESVTNKPQTVTTTAAVNSNTVKPQEAKKPEEVKTESGEKVAEGVSKEAPKAETTKPTASEKASTPSDDAEKSMFEGEPESKFHADFRTFANRLFTVLKTIKVGGGKGGKGIIGGALSGIGKGFGGLARGVGSAYGGLIRGVGSAVGGIARGAGTAISGIANSGIPSALINGTGSLLGGLAKGYGSMAGGIFRGIGAGVGGIAKGVGNLFGGKKDDSNKESFIDKAKKVGTALKGFIIGSKPKYVDIYLKDQVEVGNPLLSAKQQEDGVFFEDGSKVESSADITKPVFGKKPGSDESQCLITKENIEHGLVDKNNDPLGKKSASILDKMGFAGKILKLGGKIGKGLFDFWGGLLGFGKKGLEAAGKGAKTILGRLFGIEGHDFSTYHKNVLDRLDRIIVLMGGEPPKDSDVKSSEVKTESKDEIKPIDDKKKQDVKEGLTPTEYPGVYKNKQGRYVDARGKFVKDPTKQAQSADTKPEETKEPEQKQEVVNESGDKVAEGVSKPSSEEVKQDVIRDQTREQDSKVVETFKSMKLRDKIGLGWTGAKVGIKSLIKGQSIEKTMQETLKKGGKDADRIKSFYSSVTRQEFPGQAGKEDKAKKASEAAAKDRKEDAEKNKQSQLKFMERLKKREEERKKALEEKKKRQAERDAINDKAEKEGAERLKNMQAKPGYEKAKERIDKAKGWLDNLKEKAVDKIMGSENKFGRRTGGLLRNTKAMALKMSRSKIGRRWGGKYVAQFINKPGATSLKALKAGGSFAMKAAKAGGKFLAPVGKFAAGLGAKAIAPITGAISAAGGIGPAMAAMATNPITLGILGAAAAGLSVYKGVKGASKANTKKNLGIKEGVQAKDRIASGLSQALTFGLGGKGAAKFVRKGIDYLPGVGLVTALMGDKDAMTDKEIKIFRTKCENKIKKGMKGYDTILARFNKAVRMEDWPLARSISGNETSLVKNIVRAIPGTALAIDVGKWAWGKLFGDDNKPLTSQQINAFRKKCQKRIAKKDKMAEKILQKFDDAVSEENWKLARELSGKKAEGLFTGKSAGRNIGMTVGAIFGPLGMLTGAIVGDAFDDPNKKPMSKKEIEETTKFLTKQASYNPKAKKVLDKFQEAVENEDWKTARKLSGKEGKTLLSKIGSGLKTTGRIIGGVMTLGLSELLMPGDQDKPLDEKEIQQFRSKMQFRIKKGDGTASRKLEAFDDAIAQQKWKKARQISKIKDESALDKTGKFLKKITWDWIVGNDEEPMTEAEQQKFRDSMQRKIKMGDKQAQRKLDAFEDAVGNQKWKRARTIAKMPNDGWGTKAVKAVKGFVAGLFGSDEQAMTELEIKKFRDKMQDEIKGGNKAAQKKLDKFEDAVADQNWRRARAIADTPNKDILTKAKEAVGKFLWSGDQDSAMTDAEVEKFENEMNGRIQKGDAGAQKLLDQFHEAVSNGLWAKARKIANCKKDGVLKEFAKDVGKGLAKVFTFGLYRGDVTAEDVNKLQEEIEAKNDEDESGLWQKVLDRFMSLKSQGMYQEAYDYGKKMLSSSIGELKQNAKENKNVDEMEQEVRIKKRQQDVLANIQKSKEKFGWLTGMSQRRALGILYNRAKYADEVNDEFLDQIEEELTKIDENAEISKDSASYDVDANLKKMMQAQAKLRDVAVNTRPKVSFWKHPFQWRNIRRLVDELSNTSPDELSEEKLLDWNNRLSEIDGSGVKKITQEDIDKKKQEIEDAKKKKQEGTAAAKAEGTKPDQASKTIQVGNVTIKKNADGSRQTSVVSQKGKVALRAATGVLIGNTLVPNEGESKEDYLKRYESLKGVYKTLGKKEPFSIYTEEGRNSYIAGKQMKAAMSGGTYDQEKDPVLMTVPASGEESKQDSVKSEDVKSQGSSSEKVPSVGSKIKSFAKKALPWMVAGSVGVAGLATLGVAKGAKAIWNKFFKKKKDNIDTPAGKAAEATKPTITNVSGSFAGNTLIPIEGENVKAYETRLKTLQDKENEMAKGFKRRPKLFKSIYTEEGLESYKAAKSMAASMRGSEYDPNSDPILQLVETNKALPVEKTDDVSKGVATPSRVAKPKETITGVAKQTVGSLWDKAKTAVGSIGRSFWGGLKKGLTAHGEAQMAQANAISSIFGKKKTDDKSSKTVGTLTKLSQGKGSIGEQIGYGMEQYRISGDDIAKEVQNIASDYGQVRPDHIVGHAVSNLIEQKYPKLHPFMRKKVINHATAMFVNDNAVSGKYPYPENVVGQKLRYTKTVNGSKLTDTELDTAPTSKVAAKPSVTGQLEGVATPSRVANNPVTRSDQIDFKAQQSMEKHAKTSELINRDQQLSENNLADGASAEEAATRDQTQVLSEKLDKLTDAVYGVRDATVEAGEGTSQRINNAQNYAIAQSAAYANGAIARTKPKPKEPGLKPAAINTVRPALA